MGQPPIPWTKGNSSHGNKGGGDGRSVWGDQDLARRDDHDPVVADHCRRPFSFGSHLQGIKIRPQFMPGNAGQALDLKNAKRWNLVPLINGGAMYT